MAGTERMWMRFDLLQRTPGAGGVRAGAAARVGRLAALGAGPDGVHLHEAVQGLRAPGAYRARVRFRWYDAAGRLQRTHQRTTRTCRQPDPRPDLTAGALTAAPGLGAETATYLLDVGNAGRGPRPRRSTSSSRSPGCRSRRSASPASPRARTVLSIPGPRCAPGSTVRFVLDAGAAVAESDEADDVVDRAVPGPAASDSVQAGSRDGRVDRTAESSLH